MTRGVIRLGVAAAIFAVALPCAAATSPRATPRLAADRLRAAALTPFAPPLLDTGRFAFTAPGRTGSTARVDTVERAFRFTPSGQTARKGIAVGVTTRVAAAAPDASRVASSDAPTTPSAYNVGVAVGWRGVAVSGGYSRLDAPVTVAGPNRRDAVDLGISYAGRNWKTKLQVAAESGSPVLLTPLERRYSVDLGGAYAVGPRLSLSGGVRYKLAPVSPNLFDPDRPDQSVYLGTAFSF